MKEKVNKKIFFIAIILLVLVLIVLFNNDIGQRMINNIRYGASNSKVEKINKDIIISTEYKVLLDEDNGYYLQTPTGYASTTTEYYVDLEKNEIYYVEDYNVYQPGDKDYGHHYTIKNSKKLSNEEIEDLKSIENLSSDDNSSGEYYQITYKNKTIYTKLQNNVTIINILEELKYI